MGKLTGLSITSNMGVEKKDDIIARLQQQVLALDTKADSYEQTLEDLRKTMLAKERELSNLRHNVYID